jgi:hypothetical protein
MQIKSWVEEWILLRRNAELDIAMHLEVVIVTQNQHFFAHRGCRRGEKLDSSAQVETAVGAQNFAPSRAAGARSL